MSDVFELLAKDAEDYLSSAGMRVSPEARGVIRDAEELAWRLNNSVYPWTYLAVLLKRVREVRAALARRGCDPDFAADAFVQSTSRTAEQEQGSAPYDPEGSYSNSNQGSRHLVTRSRLVDLSIEIGKRCDSKVTGVTLFEALLQCHDEVFPSISNSEWSTPQLQTPFNTLSHVIGHYEPSLFIKFSDLLADLGIAHREFKERLLDQVPPDVRPALLGFLVDHPDHAKNCFLIMPFGETPLHRKIASILKSALKNRGFNLVRADEGVYSEDLFTNIQAHLYGCRLAIAVFERILTNDFNPNVSLEVGFFLGLQKPICLLKERTLPRLPSDLVGRLYLEFDSQDLEGSLCVAVNRWLRERRIAVRTHS